MRSQKPPFTAAHLRRVLSYNRRTGVFRWRISPRTRTPVGTIAGGLDSYGYWAIQIDWNIYKAHLLAWYYVHGVWPNSELDHRDMVRHHNWIGNLRKATQAQNNANRRRYKNNKSGLKGVYRHSQGRWCAMIRKDSRGIYLGLFDNRKEAHRAYVRKAKELFGSYARH